MSFRVTQCPACESTFNTSPALLESAAGKVRCGACLTVFEAAENFLDTELDASEGEPESVFLTQSPQGYFDPSRFLTRAALQEGVPEHGPQQAGELQPEREERAQSSEEIQASQPAPEPTSAIEQETQADPFETAPPLNDTDIEMVPTGTEPDSSEDSSASAAPVDAPATEIPAEDAAEFMDLVAAGLPANFESEQTGYSNAEALAVAEEITERLLPQPPQAPQQEDLQDSPELQAGRQAAEAESIPDHIQERPPARLTESCPEEDEEESDAAMAEYAYWSGIQDEEQQSAPVSDTSGVNESTADVSAPEPVAERPREPSPEAFSLHVNFSVQTTPFAPDQRFAADPERTTQPTDTAGIEDSEAAEGSDTLEQEFNAALEEEDFQNAVSDSDTAADNVGQPDVELPEATADTESDAEALAWHDSSAAADNEAAAQERDFIEALQPPVAAETTDEDSAPPDEFADDAGHSAAPAIDEEPAAEPVDQSVEAIRARALRSELRDEDALEAIPRENLKALGEFSSPVEIVEGKRRRLGRRLAWAGVAVVAAIGLAGQYLWQEMEHYSQVASVRPLYELGCHYLGCELPVYNNIDAIQSNNLSVRTHPSVANALSVNVEFRNSAAFPQRFPIMILSFNSATNSVIALREFSPREYLPEALRNRRLMPARSPIQIALEIMDPGADAVNYTLAFRRP